MKKRTMTKIFFLICALFLSINTISNSTLSNIVYGDGAAYQGAHDGEFYAAMEYCTDEEMIYMVRTNCFSTGKIEEMLNMGRCLGYYETLKAEGWIPQDFVPSSMQTSSNNASSNTTTEQTTTGTSTSTADTSTQTEKTYTDAEIEAAWKETSRTEATCIEAGVIKYKNSITGKTKSEEIPTVDHDYEIIEEILATCTEDGNVTYTCTMCGDSYSEEIEKLEHDYVETSRTEATCTEDGEVLYVCAECENAYADTLPATGHTKGEWDVTKDAGTFTKGEKVLKCTVCGEVLETADIPRTSPVSLVVIVIGVVIVAGIGSGTAVFAKKKRKA